MYGRKHSYIFVTTLIGLVAASKFLEEKPDFITPCKSANSDFKQCVVKNFQAFFVEFKDGVPGLKSVGPVDPFHIKRISLTENTSSIISINIGFTKVELRGLRNTIVDDADFDQTKLVTKMTLSVPELIMTSDYQMKGRILALALDGSGKAENKFKNLKFNLICKLKLREENGFKFTDLDKLRVEVADVGLYQSHWENLFNGQKDLEDSANAVFNDNWKELFTAFRPSFTATVQKVLEDRFKKIFAYIPASYYFGDL
ncbi:circadian clock-controlled protein daywake-like [Musca vetustissima]|uniref:circadian clock-controlled protein daywake-like n=1 Tax=Musca vetustissima TaxID=27455 RepID=UPI002AB62897|nr:circadian clock-controlled protein daywake-like [Musca vetustissima]